MKSPQKAILLTIGLLICLGALPAPQEDTYESLKSMVERQGRVDRLQALSYRSE